MKKRHAFVFSLEPIDLDELLNTVERASRPPVRLSEEHRRRVARGVRRAWRRRKKVAGTARHQARRSRVEREGNATEKILLAMQPGEWLSRPDIRARSGQPYGSIKVRVPDAERRAAEIMEETILGRPSEA